MGVDIKSRVGEKAGPFEDVVSSERIEKFARAVGAVNRGVAPPTFLTVCRKAEFALFDQLGFPLSRVLHGEQSYSYENDILPGDVLSYETRLAQALEKKGASSSMLIMTFETKVTARRGQEPTPIGISNTTIILRGGNSD